MLFPQLLMLFHQLQHIGAKRLLEREMVKRIFRTRCDFWDLVFGILPGLWVFLFHTAFSAALEILEMQFVDCLGPGMLFF